MYVGQEEKVGENEENKRMEFVTKTKKNLKKVGETRSNKNEIWEREKGKWPEK